MKKWLLLVVALVSISAGLYWFVIGRFNPSPPRPNYSAPADRAEAHRQDLDYLRHLLALDRSFSPDEAQAFEAGRLDLLQQAGTLSSAQLVLGISRLVALSGNGHTNVAPGVRARLLNRVPLRMAWFVDGLHIVRTDRAHARLRGAQVLTINGRTPDDLFAALKPFRGGRAGYARAGNLLLMESPQALASVDSASDADSLQLSVRLDDGRLDDVRIAALPPDPEAPTTRPWVYLSPEAAATIDPDGIAALAANVSLPSSLRDYGRSIHAEETEGVLYVHLWSMTDDEVGSITQQLDDLLQSKSKPWRGAIVDVRFNGGGDYTKVHAFASRLPSHVVAGGPIIVLVNNDTFSAALVTAAWLKYFGEGRTVMAGEALGDEPRFWAEGDTLTLPNSKLAINFATGYHDWESGCADVVDCFTPNYWYGVAAGTLDPEPETGWRYSDYVQGRDSVLEAARSRFEAPAPAPAP